MGSQMTVNSEACHCESSHNDRGPRDPQLS